MGDEILDVDLEELVENYIWGCYKRNKNCVEKLFLRKSDYLFDIRWEYVDFKHVTNPEKQQSGQSITSDQNDTEEVSANKDVSDDDIQMGVLVKNAKENFKRDVELYISEFKNATPLDQKYIFTTSRETICSTKFELQEGYTLGKKRNLEINFKKIVKIRGESSEHFTLTEKNTEEFKKTLTWNVNTEIEVPKLNIAKASLYVYEIPTKATFVVKTTVSLPTGRLPVTIRQVKDGKAVHRETISNLSCLFDDDYLKNSTVEIISKKIVTETGREVLDKLIVLTTRGICQNVSFTNQHVDVECKLIKGISKSTQTDGGQTSMSSTVELAAADGCEEKDL